MFSVDEEGRAICLFGLKESLDYQCDIGLMEANYGEFDYYGGDIFALRVTFVDDWMRDYIKLRSDEVWLWNKNKMFHELLLETNDSPEYLII